jgi:hypothetical protein
MAKIVCYDARYILDKCKKDVLNYMVDIEVFTQKDYDLLTQAEKDGLINMFGNKIFISDISIPVTFNNTIVGYTCNEGKTIEFVDNNARDMLQDMLNIQGLIGISSRSVGNIDEYDFITNKKPIELSFFKLNKLI